MSEDQRETAFLKKLLNNDPREERQQFESCLTKAQGDEQCVKRAMAIMLRLMFVSLAGLAYTALLLQHVPDKYFDLIVKGFCVLGLGSIISFVWFFCVWLSQRDELNRKREECRQFIERVIG
jgi:hypothetical protein